MRDDDELFQRLTEMLSPQHEPPAMVSDLAKQCFALRTIDAELAELTADSYVEGTAAAVRRGARADIPRLLTFETPGLLVELEVGGSSRGRRILGELVPTGPASIELRQPGISDSRPINADDGRFMIEVPGSGPFSLTCRRPGRTPVVTEWTSLD
jgi:hypothetical protein